MPTPSQIKQWEYSDVINRRMWDGKYVFENFSTDPVVSSATGLSGPTGTADDTNSLITLNSQFRWNVIGTQVQVAPALDSAGFGLNLVQTNTDGQGMEMLIGNPLYSPMSFLIGTDAAFFIQARFKVATVAGVDPLIIGFRKAAAYDATLANYADFAAIGLVGGAGKIQTQTQKATAGVVTTDTTETGTDATVFQIKVMVSSTGVVTYQLNYEEPTVVAAYTFTDALTVVPFIRMVVNATTSASASTNYLECGFQS